MNEPLISPLYIYLISIVDSVRDAMYIISIIGTIIAIVATLCMMCEGENIWKYTKYPIFILPVCGFISMFIPPQQTCIAMLVASKTTPENLKYVENSAVVVYEQLREDIFKLIEYNTSKQEEEK